MADAPRATEVAGSVRRAALDHPVHERAERHAERERRERRQRRRARGTRQPAEPHARRRPARAAGRCGAPAPRPLSASSPPSTATLRATSTSDSAHAAAVSKPSLNSVKIATVKVWYCDDFEGAVLGEQAERDEQAAAEQRRADLAQRDPQERPPRAQPEAARRLLEARVEVAQRARHGQVHERVQRQRHDHHRGRGSRAGPGAIETQPKPTRSRGSRAGAPAAPPTGAARGSVGALHAPRRADAEHGAQQRAGDRQPHRVPQQHRDRVAEQQPLAPRPSPTAAPRTTRNTSGSSTSPAAISAPATLTSGQRRAPDHERGRGCADGARLRSRSRRLPTAARPSARARALRCRRRARPASATRAAARRAARRPAGGGTPGRSGYS